MKSVDSTGTQLFIAVGYSILVVNHDNLSCSDRSMDGSVGLKVITPVSGTANADASDLKSSNTDYGIILTVTVNEGLDYIIAAYSDKMIRCWSISTQQLLGESRFKKQVTTLECSCFESSLLERAVANHCSKICKVLLVSDKAGDVYASGLPLLSDPVFINRHTASVITDMALSKSILVTSDRDEKVRVSHFPDVENIQAYCLGHTSVVSSVCIATIDSKTVILSTGWDHKLIVWNPTNGSVLCSILCQDNSDGRIDTEVVDNAGNVVDESDHDDCNIIEGKDEADKEDCDVVDDKQYDESRAGRYPSKVVAAVLFGKSVVAVRFKQSSSVRLYVIEQRINTEVGGLVDSYTIRELSCLGLHLKATPVDVEFSATSSPQLVALLPKPIGLQIFELSSSLEIFEVDVNPSVVDRINILGSILPILYRDNMWTSSIAIIACHLTIGKETASLEQNVLRDPDDRMKKHALNKRFNSEENLKFRTKKGAKRSKRK